LRAQACRDRSRFGEDRFESTIRRASSAKEVKLGSGEAVAYF
jgi:hypothetical protein